MEKPEVINCLATCLSNSVVMTFKAQGHHWNVEGSDFSEYHAFFKEIYEDVYSAIDPLAENMRKLDSAAPYRLIEFARLATVKDSEVGTDAMAMCADLLEANDAVLVHLNMLFTLSSEYNEQGIADFAAGRIDMHKKWRWQLKAHLAGTGI